MYKSAKAVGGDAPRLRLLSDQDMLPSPDGRSGIRRLGRVVGMAIVPLVGLLGLTVLFRMSAADVNICRYFYGGGSVGWPQYAAEPWSTLYRVGPYPGLLLGILGGLVGLGSYVWAGLRRWREMGLFLALLLAVGPGLAINGIVKPQWSRPRPVQIKAFGGQHEFISVWGFGPRGASKSFPSGHASMGFYLMAPAFLLYQKRPRLAVLFLILGFAGGGILGLARIAQGQHFASDVLWAGGMVYLCGLFLAYLFHRFGESDQEEPATSEGPVIYQFRKGRRPVTVEAEPDTAPQTGQPRRAA